VVSTDEAFIKTYTLTELKENIKDAYILMTMDDVPPQHAKLIPLEKQTHRKPGIAKGRVTKEFFEPLPDEELRLWE